MGDQEGDRDPGGARERRPAAAAAQGLQGRAAAHYRHRPFDGRQVPLRLLLGDGYDVSDPFKPRLTGKVRIGGIVSKATHPGARNGARLSTLPSMRFDVGQIFRRMRLYYPPGNALPPPSWPPICRVAPHRAPTPRQRATPSRRRPIRQHAPSVASRSPSPPGTVA